MLPALFFFGFFFCLIIIICLCLMESREEDFSAGLGYGLFNAFFSSLSKWSRSKRSTFSNSSIQCLCKGLAGISGYWCSHKVSGPAERVQTQSTVLFINVPSVIAKCLLCFEKDVSNRTMCICLLVSRPFNSLHALNMRTCIWSKQSGIEPEARWDSGVKAQLVKVKKTWLQLVCRC